MRSLLVVVTGLAIGWLPFALDNAIPKTAIPYNGDVLRSAIAEGMSRAGSATLVGADNGGAQRRY